MWKSADDLTDKLDIKLLEDVFTAGGDVPQTPTGNSVQYILFYTDLHYTNSGCLGVRYGILMDEEMSWRTRQNSILDDLKHPLFAILCNQMSWQRNQSKGK